MTPSDHFVSTEEGLSTLCRKLAGSPAIAVDTEFHSERRFWPELFLVQLADSSGAWAVDPAQGLDLSPLAVLMADDSIVKVMHSSRNDIAILRRSLGVEFRNVFDTQLAAAFLGYGEQSSLYNLLTDVCGIKAKKAFCLSDWSRRPLADEQIEYALDDVRHLMPLYARLGGELKRKKRFEWYAGEAASLVEPSSYEVNIAEMYRRARSAGKLKKANLPVLWALVGWRERKAMELDRPRPHIAQDSLLARLAMMSPGSMDSLERLRGMPSGYIAKWGPEVLEVVRQAVANPPSDVPEIPYQRPDGAASARADILRIYLKQKAHSIRIAPSLLLPRETLDKLCSLSRSDAIAFIDGSELAGWRREALAEDLKSLLSGKLALVLGSTTSGGLKFVKT